MIIFLRALLFAVPLLLMLPGTASAYTVTFCATLQVDYSDSDLGTDDAAYGDFFASNSNKLARGVKVMVVGSDLSIQSDYADWSGSTPGCTMGFTMTAAHTYDVLIYAEAEVAGNTIKVKNTPTLNELWYGLALDNWSPSATATVNIVTANTHDAWNVLAAATHAMWRRDGGLENKTFDFYTVYDAVVDPCNNGTGACSAGGDVFLNTSGNASRFVIVHEMGHALGYFASDASTSVGDYTANSGICYTASASPRVHEMNSKEWQSSAIKEGWAHFYAAVAFNELTETDCGFVYYKSQNYDLDLSIESADPHAISCEAGPIFTLSSVDAKAYMEDWCDGTWTNRGVELDWLRFWWDFLQEESTVNFADCASIYDNALNGTTWPAIGPWDPTPGSGTPDANRPYIRMEDAAAFLGLATEWAAHVDNGVDH